MKRVKIVSKVTLSIALISALGLAGCGSDSKSVNNSSKADTLAVNSSAIASNSKPAKPLEEAKRLTPSLKTEGYNVVVGKVSLDETPNTKVRSLSKNQAEISAYNLNSGVSYKTLTDTNGNYELSGLADGEYQIFAQNSRYAKEASQRVTLSKSSRKVVNFSLQATGSVSGKIIGASVVYIPGTDHVSIADSNGEFSLSGVAVGKHVLMYEGEDDQTGVVEVSVVAGEVFKIDQESGFGKSESGHFDLFGYVDTNLEYGVLELHNKGIRFDIQGLKYDSFYKASSESNELTKARIVKDYDDYHRDFSYLKKYITLKNSVGNLVDFIIEDGAIKTKEVVAKGEYTLTFSKDISEILYRGIEEDRVYKFTVDNISVAFANMDHGARVIDLNFPKELTDEEKKSMESLKVLEKGVVESLSVQYVWIDNRSLSIFGSFKTGVEYELNPNDAQKKILGDMKILNNLLEFGHVEVSNIYPKKGTNNINVDQKLFVNINYANQIDPSTVEFKLGTKIYKGKDILFDGEDRRDWDKSSTSSANISFRHESLEYNKEYTLKFSAKDISGNSIAKTTSFKTMRPSIVEMEPTEMNDLFDDMQRISFNVPVDKESGTIVIENLKTPSASANIDIDKTSLKFDAHEIYFSLSSLKPNSRYKITASGFKDLNGIDIPSKEIEFATPPRMLFIPEQYSQNMNVEVDDFNHKVELFFFGGLSDQEKEFLESNLVLTSYDKVIEPDDSHPLRKLSFTPVDNGLVVSVAFTIDADTNYELSLASLEGLDDIIFPDNKKKLVSFSTINPTTSNGTSNRPADQIVTIGDRDWLVIQTSELKDDNATSSFSEAFFPKRTWAEADYFCKNFKDEKNPNATWALPTQIELLSIMTPTIEDVRKFDETTSQFVVDAKVLPSEGTVDAFHSAIFYNVENKTVYLGNGSLGSAQISYTAVDKGQPEEALFTCIKQ